VRNAQPMSATSRQLRLRQILGRRVRDERLARDWSQERLAEIADLTQVYISEIEAGKRAVSIDVIEALSNAFRLEAAELLTRKGP